MHLTTLGLCFVCLFVKIQPKPDKTDLNATKNKFGWNVNDERSFRECVYFLIQNEIEYTHSSTQFSSNDISCPSHVDETQN